MIGPYGGPRPHAHPITAAQVPHGPGYVALEIPAGLVGRQLLAQQARELAAELLAAADIVDPDGVFCLHCASADHAQEEHDRIAALTGAEHAAALAEFNARRRANEIEPPADY